MTDDRLHEIVKTTLREIKSQSLSEKVKSSVMTMIASAAGALITVLLIAQWSKMDKSSEYAKDRVYAIEETIVKRNQSLDAQLSVMIDRIAKIENMNSPITSVPMATPPGLSVEDFESTKEQIQQQIDKEVYRGTQRK